LKKSITALAWLLALALLASRQSSGQAAEPHQPAPVPIVRRAGRADLSPRADSLPRLAAAATGAILEARRGVLPSSPWPDAQPATPAQGILPGPGRIILPRTLLTFDGIANINSMAPADPNGDIGPAHYVQIVNASFAVFSRSGQLLVGPVAINHLWSGFGGECELTNRGDPIVLYDELADRWLISQLAFFNKSTGPYYQCVALSQGSDPGGAYYRYAFKISDTLLNDYPKLGVWPNGYTLTVNLFAFGSSFAGPGVGVFERDKMLAGDPQARLIFLPLEGNTGGMLPADLDGQPPPRPTPGLFVQFNDDMLENVDMLRVWELQADWEAPEDTRLSEVGRLLVARFDSDLCGYSQNCIPQKGTNVRLDAISSLLMYRLQYRNFGGYEALVLNHTVDVGGGPAAPDEERAGIRWYELRRTNGQTWKVFQQGTFGPDDGLHRWMGSAAMNGRGELAIGYSVSGTGLFPSIRYAGRLAADPAGTLTIGEGALWDGGGHQTLPTGRWGDYSMLAVDPLDDCTFWYTQEYYPQSSYASWHTRIGAFQLNGCGEPAMEQIILPVAWK
jgi:hypothetical protein